MATVRFKRIVGPVEVCKLSVGQMDNNVYIISNDSEALLIDGSAEAAEILSEIGSRKLKAIVQTHNHMDHVQALEELVAATDAPVWVHPLDRSGIPVASSDLSEGDEFSVGDVSLTVLHTPGHTPGGISLLMKTDGQTLLFAGDTLFPGGPGGTFGDPAAFTTIMESLVTKFFVLDDDTEVLPGHGDDTTIGDERPNLEEWRARGY